MVSLTATLTVLLVCFVQRRKLLKELGDHKIPFLGPSDRGFQQLVSRTSHLCIEQHIADFLFELYALACLILHDLVKNVLVLDVRVNWM